MKKLILIICVAFSIFACKKEDEAKPLETGNNSTTNNPQPKSIIGKVIFYTPAYPFAQFGTGTEVWVSNVYKGKITNAPVNKPACGSTWGLNIALDSGTYSFHAQVRGCTNSSYNKNWDSTFVITPEACTIIKLTNQQ